MTHENNTITIIEQMIDLMHKLLSKPVTYQEAIDEERHPVDSLGRDDDGFEGGQVYSANLLSDLIWKLMLDHKKDLEIEVSLVEKSMEDWEMKLREAQHP